MNGKRQRRVLAIATVIGAAFLGAAFLAACNPPASDQHLQQQAAQATEQAKQGSKEALSDARVAAKNAEQAVNDVASGNFSGKSQADHRPSALHLLPRLGQGWPAHAATVRRNRS